MGNSKQGITPHLWFENNASEAVDLYCSIFPNSKINYVTVLRDTPSGDADSISFELGGQPFMALSGGPFFKFNPSISFMLNFDPSKDDQAQANLDRAWDMLSEGGKPLMPLQEYPFSKRYGWIEDKYGLSWQLILTNPDGEERPFIIPALMFIGDKTGLAGEAINFYLSVFSNSRKGTISQYPEEMKPDKESVIQFADFLIDGTWFAAMDSGRQHDFDFNESVSFMVFCDDQKSIDYYWNKLSAVPEAEQCGWIKDKYGLSWQIVPTVIEKMMASGSQEQVDRVTQAILPMKKLVIADIEKAYKGGK